MNIRLSHIGRSIPFFLLLFLSCDEPLPERNDQARLFTANLSWSYNYSKTDNSYAIKLILKNNYSETIQAKAAVDGEIQIEWLIPRELIGDIATTRTVKLTTSNLYGARQYDPSKGTLTIASGDSVTLSYYWNLKMDDSTYLFYQPAFNDGRKWDCLWQESAGVGYRFFFKPQAYKVTGHVRLFEQTGILYAPEILFTSCYIYPYRDKSTTISTCATIYDPQRACEIYQSFP